MMDQRELDRRWFSWERIEGVHYGLNDAVQIAEGEHSDEFGAVIALLSVNPAIYLVELGSGRDVEIIETNLRLIEKHHPSI